MDITVDFDDKDSKQKYWEFLKTLSGKWVMSNKREPISYQQIKFYYAAIITPICDLTGDEQEGVHYYLKSLFLKELTIAFGEEKWRVKSITELDRIEFHHYAERCIQFCAERLNLIIKDSDTYLSALKELSLKERMKLVKRMKEVPFGYLFVDRFDSGRSNIYSRTPIFDEKVLMSGTGEAGFGLFKAGAKDEDYLTVVKVADDLYRIRCHVWWLKPGLYHPETLQSNHFTFKLVQQ